MDTSGSGAYYAIILILLLVLGGTIAYVLMRRRPRDPRGQIKRAADDATRRNFDKDR